MNLNIFTEAELPESKEDELVRLRKEVKQPLPIPFRYPTDGAGKSAVVKSSMDPAGKAGMNYG